MTEDLQTVDENTEGACDLNPFPHKFADISKANIVSGHVCQNWTPESHGKRLNRRLRELGLIK